VRWTAHLPDHRVDELVIPSRSASRIKFAAARTSSVSRCRCPSCWMAVRGVPNQTLSCTTAMGWPGLLDPRGGSIRRLQQHGRCAPVRAVTSFLKLRNASISLDLSEHWPTCLGPGRAGQLEGVNLITKTDYIGYDPRFELRLRLSRATSTRPISARSSSHHQAGFDMRTRASRSRPASSFWRAVT